MWADRVMWSSHPAVLTVLGITLPSSAVTPKADVRGYRLRLAQSAPEPTLTKEKLTLLRAQLFLFAEAQLTQIGFNHVAMCDTIMKRDRGPQ